MLRLTLVGFYMLMSILLLACAGSSAEVAPATAPIPTEQASVTEPESGENLDGLQVSVDAAVEQFRQDVAINTVRLFQHTIWVLADENAIKERMAPYGVELVGDVIRGADYEGRVKDIWGVKAPPMSGGQAYVAVSGDNLVVAFRSTASDDGWEVTLNVLTDLTAVPKKIGFIDKDVDKDVPNAKEYRKAKVHAGFHNEYLRYRDRILEYIGQHPDKNIYVTGHSLGGALAALSSFDIAAHTQRPVTVFTFGQPRVGDRRFREAYDELVPNSYRVVVDGDPIARLPGGLFDYQHVGKLLQLDQSGFQLAPEDIRSSAVFQVFDFPKHILRAYHKTLGELRTACQPTESQEEVSENQICLNVGWLITAAEAERESARKAWDVIPEGTIPWQDIPFDDIPIEKIPADKLPTEFPNIDLPPWEKMIPLDAILIDNIPIDEIPLDELPLDRLKLDKLKPDELPLDKLPLDKLPLDKLPLKKLPK